MDKDLAKKIVETGLRYSGELNRTVAIVRAECSDEEFKIYRRAVAYAMTDMLVDVLRPIFHEHPDLEPEALKS